MKKLLLFFAFAYGLSAAPTFVQGKSCVASSGGTSLTCAFTSNVAANDLLVIMGEWAEATTTTSYTPVFSSSAGVTCTWGVAVPAFRVNGDGYGMVQVEYCVVPSGGAETTKLTLNASVAFITMSIMEYSGVSTASPLDVSTSASADPSLPNNACAAGPTATLAGTGELAISLCTGWNNGQVWAAVSGWTNRTTASSNVVGIYDSVRAAATAISWADTLQNGDVWNAFVVTFKPAGAVAAARVLPNRILF